MKLVLGISITHLLFVDDVIVLGKNSVEEWKYLYKILGIFCLAYGMEFNP